MTDQSRAQDLNRANVEQPEKDEAFQVILKGNVSFENPHPDVHVARVPIANATWIKTGDGIVLVDTLLTPVQAQQMKGRMQETGDLVKTVIYTHHHRDHIGGSTVFADDTPEILAHRFFPENMEKYDLLNVHRPRIASIQFNIPLMQGLERPYLKPTRLYDYETTFTRGDKTFELYHARAETDDATWIHIPEISTVLVGDLIIAGLPNIGNPFKPTRYSMSWVRALEKVREKNPELLIAHGGRAVYAGADVGEVLDVTIECIHSLQNQVFEAINDDMPLDEMIHHVKLPPHLRDHKFLAPVYSRTEFAVYNIYRWYHGYFDHNPAHLLPRPDKEVNAEINALIAEPDKILTRAQELNKAGKPQLALQVLDILFKENPDYPGARELHLNLLEQLCEADSCLMSRNTWVYFMEQDRALLKEKS